MKTWPIYMRLQAEAAYGQKHSGPSLSTQAQDAEVARFLDAWRARERRSALIIGAGGPEEVAALAPHLPSEMLWALTSHGPEADAIEASHPGVTVCRGDMHDTPLPTSAFEVVFSANVLEHALAPYCALMEARRVIREGGLGYFVIPSFEGDEGGVGPFHLHCLTEPVWQVLLRKCGFAFSDVYPQPGAHPASLKTYTHYRCTAVPLQWPHDRILSDLIAYKAEHL